MKAETAEPEAAKPEAAAAPTEAAPSGGAPAADGCHLDVTATESRLDIKTKGEDGDYEKVGTKPAHIGAKEMSESEAPPAWPRATLEKQGYKQGAFADALGEPLLAKQVGDGFVGYGAFDANDVPARAVYVIPGMETSFKYEYAYTRVCK
ncbi:MAG: hypothetical protein KC417_11505 [Myxococcales bacterium]|nr:hypothetical protein [Myxococcales bacterium]